MSTITRKITTFCKKQDIRRPVKKLIVADCLNRLNGYTGASNLYIALRNKDIKISYAMVYLSLGWLTENGFAECKAETGSGRSEKMFRIRK